MQAERAWSPINQPEVVIMWSFRHQIYSQDLPIPGIQGDPRQALAQVVCI